MENIIINLMEKFGYFAVSFLIFVENMFPPIPSEVILAFGGFMTTKTTMNVLTVTIFATVGSVLGAIVLYYVGSIFSEERLIKIITSKYGRLLRLKPEDIKNANKWFNKVGSKAVFFCRFIPIIRSLISIPAGMNKMNMKVFLLLTTVGSFIWNGVITFMGRKIGEKWHLIVDVMDRFSDYLLIIFIVLAVSVIGIFYYRRIKEEKRD